MPRDLQTIGGCPNCGSQLLTCLYNHFDNGQLSIDSWEHKCPNCGQRQTRAVRSDDPEAAAAGDPLVCPYCGRSGRTA